MQVNFADFKIYVLYLLFVCKAILYGAIAGGAALLILIVIIIVVVCVMRRRGGSKNNDIGWLFLGFDFFFFEINIVYLLLLYS